MSDHYFKRLLAVLAIAVALALLATRCHAASFPSVRVTGAVTAATVTATNTLSIGTNSITGDTNSPSAPLWNNAAWPGGGSGNVVASGTNDVGWLLTASTNDGVHGVWSAPIWFSSTATDAEGGTIYQTISTNPQLPQAVSFATSFLTNFQGDFSIAFSAAYPANDLGSILATNVFYFELGNKPGLGQTLLGSSDIYNIGAFVGDFQTLRNSSRVFNFGHTAGSGQVLTSSGDIFNLGHSISGHHMDGTLDVYSFGNSITYNATNSHSLFSVAAGGGTGANNYMTNCYEIFQWGSGVGGGSGHIKNSSRMFFYGENTATNLQLDGSSDIYVTGSRCGIPSIDTGISHAMIVGSGGMATNSNDFVFGDSAYNYFFPGESMRVEGPVSLGSTLTTGDPGSGAAAWELGKVITGASVTLVTTNYVEVKIGGTVVKLAIVK